MYVYKVCPMSHVPRVFGECDRCADWFTLRKDRTIRSHRCDPYEKRGDGIPRSLALICLNHRWNIANPFGGVIQTFRLTDAGLEVAA